MVARWHASPNFRTALRDDCEPRALSCFLPDAYRKLNIAYTTINEARSALQGIGFMEIQTPIILPRYNGGHSFPIQASFTGHSLGYLRTTVEERMKAAVGAGFRRIFQIGSVFRGGHEFTLLEGYIAFVSWELGEALVRRLIARVVLGIQQTTEQSEDPYILALGDNDWHVVDFVEGANVLI